VPGEYRLTRNALANLRDIYRYSCDAWDEDQADAYMRKLYETFAKLALHPDRDLSRRKRSHPFQMIACQKHFILYDVHRDETIILALMHQSADIERHVANLTPGFLKAIDTLKGTND